MVERTDTATVLAVAVLVGVAVGALGIGLLTASPGDDGGAQAAPGDGLATQSAGVDTFDSAEAYRSYVQGSDGSTGYAGGQIDVRWFQEQDVALTADVATDGAVPAGGDGAEGAGGTGDADGGSAGGSGDASRHSGTNVQVTGVDEPDLLKTDGEWMYYAGAGSSRFSQDRETQVIDARSPDAPALNGSIAAGQRLLLTNDTLVTIHDRELYGYDVSDPADPVEQWRRSLNHSVETARYADGTVYLVLRERSGAGPRCPIRPFDGDAAGDDVALPEIACTEVYHPADRDGGDVTYTALSMDPASGEVGDEVSFVGSASNTVVYVSHDAIYLTYEDSPSRVETRLSYLQGPGSEHLDQRALDRLEELQEYDLSDRALRIEVEATVHERLERLPDEARYESDREAVQQDLTEGFETYVEEHKRELLRTGVVRVDVDGTDLEVGETGEVPGTVHDQFSLSERDGHLHVATTIDPRTAESENDLYTLDDDLEVADSVTGLGEGQRIYSVRYVDDRAYVVTFRQVDPFYAIDVSDPTDLETLGELKLPGYSDYMHPLPGDRVLGIGEEDRRVKATLFDASDPEDPVVEDDVQFDDRSTAVSWSHHAFLQDERHEVFFLPGSERGHVVSYADGLEEVATVDTDGRAQRAAYVDDYLYVFGQEELVVLDETDWSETERVDLR